MAITAKGKATRPRTKRRASGDKSRAGRNGAVAKNKSPGCPIVGIGGSAGGFEAATELLRNLPAKNGMAFVIVQHLDPHHASRLASLLGRVTPMTVTELTKTIKP